MDINLSNLFQLSISSEVASSFPVEKKVQEYLPVNKAVSAQSCNCFSKALWLKYSMKRLKEQDLGALLQVLPGNRSYT